MEARRRGDDFVVEVRQAAAPLKPTRLKFADVAAEWLEDQRARVAVGDLRPRTLDIYEQGLRLHVVPELGSRQIRSITPDDLVAWHRRRQADGDSADAIHAWWTPLRLVLAHGVRRGQLDANPADKLSAVDRPLRGCARTFGSPLARAGVEARTRPRPAGRRGSDSRRCTARRAGGVPAGASPRTAAAARSSIERNSTSSPWMDMGEAIEYTRIPAGTFRKWVAAVECDASRAPLCAVVFPASLPRVLRSVEATGLQRLRMPEEGLEPPIRGL
jgi:hypothetical protein